MRFPGRRSAVTVAPLPLVLLATLLHAPAPASAAIIGAELHNVSSDTTQFSYVGRWRSDTEDGVYQGASLPSVFVPRPNAPAHAQSAHSLLE